MRKNLIINYELNKPIEQVYGYLSDMHKYIKVHPIIYKIEEISKDKYLIFERLKLGIFSLSINYPAKIACDFNSKKIKMTALVMKIIEIEIFFELNNIESKTKIKESITFKSFLPIAFLLGPIFKKQHQILFNTIENHED